MVPWNSARTKVQLRLAIQRLRMLQQKKEAQAKASRRDIATLLERGKIETARIKVENIINEDIHVELLELLELYCELILARFGLLEHSGREPDPGIYEGVCSLIHAAPRTELKELHILREILMQKFGREFSIAVMENRDGCVNDRVMKKLVVATPDQILVNAYLAEIARGYGIDWTPPPVEENKADEEELKASVPKRPTSVSPDSASAKEADATIDAKEVDSKLPDVPPAGSSQTPPPPPYNPGGKPLKPALKKTSSPNPPDDEPAADDFNSLVKRFEALKKR
ncbi:hypothetical protein M422DRAFT_25164 [Sphaerobolus stellatus SS14]|nr:hypothetical protein M422DRAFT_25164 [Sphaerobolus stellatus SS14]